MTHHKISHSRRWRRGKRVVVCTDASSVNWQQSISSRWCDFSRLSDKLRVWFSVGKYERDFWNWIHFSWLTKSIDWTRWIGRTRTDRWHNCRVTEKFISLVAIMLEMKAFRNSMPGIDEPLASFRRYFHRKSFNYTVPDSCSFVHEHVLLKGKKWHTATEPVNWSYCAEVCRSLDENQEALIIWSSGTYTFSFN